MGRNIALLIGSGQFRPDAGFESRSSPAKDVEEIARVLTASNHRFEIKRVIDQGRSGTMSALGETLTDLERGDTLLLFYSGRVQADEGDRLCLLTADSRASMLHATSIPIKRLHEMVASSRRGTVVILLDCYCDPVSDGVLRQVRALGEIEGVNVLAHCANDEAS